MHIIKYLCFIMLNLLQLMVPILQLIYVYCLLVTSLLFRLRNFSGFSPIISDRERYYFKFSKWLVLACWPWKFRLSLIQLREHKILKLNLKLESLLRMSRAAHCLPRHQTWAGYTTRTDVHNIYTALHYNTVVVTL